MKTVPLGKLTTLVSSGSTPLGGDKVYLPSGPVMLIRSQNVLMRQLSLDDVAFITEEVASRMKRTIVSTNDVLLNITGASIGRVATFDLPEVQANVNQHVCIIRTIPELLHYRYLMHFIAQPSFQTYIDSMQHGGTRQALTFSQIRDFQIPLPPLEEQRRIAAILDKADAVRRKRKEAIALTEELLRSAFLDMFGDPVTNPKGWKIFELQSITERIVDCPHSTPKWTDKGVICLRTSNLTKGRWNWDDIRYVSEEDYITRTQRSEIISGDIILSREGTVGIAAIVPKGFRVCMGQRLVQVRPDQKLIKPSYLLRVLLWQLLPEYISQLMRGSTSQHLNVKDLRSMPIPVPSLNLQEQFSKLVSQINSLEDNMRIFSDEQEKNFNSLLQKAFRGEL